MSNTRTQPPLSTCAYCTSYSVMTVTLQPNTVAPKHSRNIMYIQTNTITKGFLWLLLSSKAIASEVVTYHYITSSHLWQLECKMYASLCIEKNSDFFVFTLHMEITGCPRSTFCDQIGRCGTGPVTRYRHFLSRPRHHRPIAVNRSKSLLERCL